MTRNHHKRRFPSQKTIAMRKATMDAFLCMMVTAVCLTYFALPVTHPFLFLLVIVLVFALVYGIAVVLRLRKAATSFPEEQREEQVTPIQNTIRTIVKGWTPEDRPPPEKY